MILFRTSRAIAANGAYTWFVVPKLVINSYRIGKCYTFPSFYFLVLLVYIKIWILKIL